MTSSHFNFICIQIRTRTNVPDEITALHRVKWDSDIGGGEGGWGVTGGLARRDYTLCVIDVVFPSSYNNE